jgi:hypothetical protein
MAERNTTPSLQNDSLIPRAIRAASEGLSPARKAVPTPTSIVPHGYTLQFLISIIKNSQPKSPSR